MPDGPARIDQMPERNNQLNQDQKTQNRNKSFGRVKIVFFQGFFSFFTKIISPTLNLSGIVFLKGNAHFKFFTKITPSLPSRDLKLILDSSKFNISAFFHSSVGSILKSSTLSLQFWFFQKWFLAKITGFFEKPEFWEYPYDRPCMAVRRLQNA